MDLIGVYVAPIALLIIAVGFVTKACAFCCGAYVRLWHESEVRHPVAHVGYWGKSGQHLLVLSFTGFDPPRTFGWH